MFKYGVYPKFITFDKEEILENTLPYYIAIFENELQVKENLVELSKSTFYQLFNASDLLQKRFIIELSKLWLGNSEELERLTQNFRYASKNFGHLPDDEHYQKMMGMLDAIFIYLPDSFLCEISAINTSEAFVVVEKEVEYNDEYYYVEQINSVIQPVYYFLNESDAKDYQRKASFIALSNIIRNEHESELDYGLMGFYDFEKEINYLSEEKYSDFKSLVTKFHFQDTQDPRTKVDSYTNRYLKMIEENKIQYVENLESEIMTYIKDYFYTIHKV